MKAAAPCLWLLLIALTAPARAQVLLPPASPWAGAAVPSINLLYADYGTQPLTAYVRADDAGTWLGAAQVVGWNPRGYRLVLWHHADPSRLRVWAVDGDPFAPQAARYELALSPVLRFDGSTRLGRGYGALLSPTPSARPPQLLFEWRPSVSMEPAPEPLFVRVDSIDADDYGPSPLLGRGPPPNLIPPQDRGPGRAP